MTTTKLAHPFALALLSAFLILQVLGTSGCGYGKPACAAVDIAKTACDVVVRYLGEDGQVHEIRLSREEMQQTARAKAARVAAEQQ